MKVKLTRDYRCSPDGINIVTYKEGDIVEGQAAVYALNEDAGKQVNEEKKPAKTKPVKPKVTK